MTVINHLTLVETPEIGLRLHARDHSCGFWADAAVAAAAKTLANHTLP